MGHFGKKQNYGDNKKFSGCQGFVGRRGARDEQAKHRVFLWQWNHSVWYNNGIIDMSHYTKLTEWARQGGTPKRKLWTFNNISILIH